MSSYTNPYEAPQQGANAGKPTSDCPGALKAIAVLFIAFGGLGIVGGLCGIPYMVIQAVAPEVLGGTGAEIDEENLNPETLGQVVQTEVQPPLPLLVVMSGLSFVVSIIMLMAGIFTLRGKAAAGLFLKLGFFGGIACQLAGIGNSIFQFMAMNQLYSRLSEQDMDMQTMQMLDFMNIMFMVIAGLGILIAAVMIVLYGLGLGYVLKSERVRNFLGAAA